MGDLLEGRHPGWGSIHPTLEELSFGQAWAGRHPGAMLLTAAKSQVARGCALEVAPRHPSEDSPFPPGTHVPMAT